MKVLMHRLAFLGCLLVLSGCFGKEADGTGESVSSVMSSASSRFEAEVLSVPSLSHNEPLSFSAEGIDATLVKSTIAAAVDASMLGRCGRTKPPSYYEDVAELFQFEEQTVYTFLYTKQSADDGLWQITLLPNLPNYKTMQELKADFDVCPPEGDMIPYALSADWLVFTSACLHGESEGPAVYGCSEIKKAVEPTIKVR
jgi:hypothetical protein